jgi:hypothetical protein
MKYLPNETASKLPFFNPSSAVSGVKLLLAITDPLKSGRSYLYTSGI